MLSIFATQAYSVSLDNCIEYNAAGHLTCTATPHTITPWKYMFPDLPGATPQFESAEEAIQYRIGQHQAQRAQYICSAITYQIEEIDDSWPEPHQSFRFLPFEFRTKRANYRQWVRFFWKQIRYNEHNQRICDVDSSPKHLMYYGRTASCDLNGGWNGGYDPSTSFCFKQIAQVSPPGDLPEDPPQCNTCPCKPQPFPDPNQEPQDGQATGNPILPALAEKYRHEIDLVIPGPHALSVERVYRSGRTGATTPLLKGVGGRSQSGSSSGGSGSSSVSSNVAQYLEPVIPPMGLGWSSNWIARISFASNMYSPNSYKTNWAYINLGAGKYRQFSLNASNRWASVGTHTDTLTSDDPSTPIGAGSRLVYQPRNSDKQYIFKISDTLSWPQDGSNIPHAATLQEIRDANGWTTRIELDPAGPASAPRPLRVTNHFGQSLVFSYTNEGQISQIRHFDAEGAAVGQVSYLYVSERLSRVTYSDGGTQELHYEDLRNPNWLTGYSRNGQRIDTYAYDAQGRATNTVKAGGALP